MKFVPFLPILFYFATIPCISQVGIGTTDPKASLDIRSSSPISPTNADGILIPKIDNFPTTNPTEQQDGMMVYATGSGTPLKGFYYWDNSAVIWKAIVGVKKIDDLSDGKSDNSGSSIFLGINAGSNDDQSDNRNVGVGFNSMRANISGDHNTATGYSSLSVNASGTKNTANGYKALQNNVAGNSNTAIGSESLNINTASYNTAVGSQTLMANSTGNYNTAVGFSALIKNVLGYNNTAIGANALSQNTGTPGNGNDNTAIGFASLEKNTIGRNNTGTGSYSLNTNTTGNFNTADGFQALKNNLDGNSNTATGARSLLSNTSGAYNTANGSYALSKNTTGPFNTASGFQALLNNTSGQNNTANGASALHSNTSGDYNTAYGNSALFLLNGGERNTAVGNEALKNIASGSNNTAVGNVALSKITAGDNNTAIGHWAGNRLTNATGNVLIGFESGGTETAFNNRLYIENSNSTTPLIYGEFDNNLLRFNADVEVNTGSLNVNGGTLFVDEVNGRVGVGTLSPTAKLQIVGGTDAELSNNTGYFVSGLENGENIVMDNNEIMARNNGGSSPLFLQQNGGNVYVGGLIVLTSDRRLKRDITQLSYGLKEILQLEPKSYFWKNREQDYKSIGLIAQEVQPIIKEIVHTRDDKDKSLSISYIELIPILINAVKEQEVKIQELEQQLSQNTELEERIAKLEALLITSYQSPRATEKVANNNN